jgi:hypothetical protein
MLPEPLAGAQVTVIGVLAWRVQRHHHSMPDPAPRQLQAVCNVLPSAGWPVWQVS